ncbi:MAG TPA: ferrochelatase [Actinomycetes bacterium]|nr:ferrochelatase [Actinomycetes bacterium]
MLLVSFGGPEGPDDVVPFLRNVTRGRDVPEERLREAGRHYFHFGGVSPINAQNYAFIDTLRAHFVDIGLSLPIYWGNRNWTPYLTEAVEQMRADGVQRALAIFTSAYSSYSGCRQYRENLADAIAAVGDGAPAIDRIGAYFNHRGFVEPFVDGTLEAMHKLSDAERAGAHLVFTTHSIPIAMAENSGSESADWSGQPAGAYVRQHQEVAAFIADAVTEAIGTELPWELVYQSRSGPPNVPWLEPDIDSHLRTIAEAGATAAIVIPIGFLSDHMEVMWDLDTQAQATADEVGLPMLRVSTPGTDPRTVAMVAELIRERIDGVPNLERERVGGLPSTMDCCPADCCPNPRAKRPVVAECGTR